MVEEWFFKPLKPNEWLSWVFVYRQGQWECDSGRCPCGWLPDEWGGAMEHTGERPMTGSVGEAPSQCPVV